MLSTRRGDDVAAVAQAPREPDLPTSDGYKDVPFDMMLAPGVRMSLFGFVARHAAFTGGKHRPAATSG